MGLARLWMCSLIKGADGADGLPGGLTRVSRPFHSAVKKLSLQIWISVRALWRRYYTPPVAPPAAPVTTNNLGWLYCVFAAVLVERSGRLFCNDANPNAHVPWQIRGSGVWSGRGGIAEERERRDGERLSKQRPSSAASSPSLLLLHPRCQKAGRRSKEANMKGIPEISVFFGAPLSPCSLLQIWKC